MRIRLEKPIPGFKGYYASADGTITKPNGTITRGSLQPTKHGIGYFRICINYQFYFVHRLIASAWVKNPRPDIYIYVDHIDQDPQNNHPDNLRWITHSLNMRNSEWKSSNGKKEGVKCAVRGVRFDDNRKKWVGSYYDRYILRKQRSFKTYQQAFQFSKTNRVAVFNTIYEEQTRDYIPITFDVRRYVVMLNKDPQKKPQQCGITVL